MAQGNAKTPESRKGYRNQRNLFFCEKVREIRLKKGLKQSELGKLAGMTTKQISELEGGRFVSDATRIVEISRALETTPNFLFGFED